MNFYTSIFKKSKKGRIARHREGGPGPKGAVMSVEFELEGQEFVALNGGPDFTFTPAVSFWVRCESQQEIDEIWEGLSRDGEKGQHGRLKDKYGLSWQIVPTILGEMLEDKEPAKSRRVLDAMLKMTKIDIAALKRAYDGT